MGLAFTVAETRWLLLACAAWTQERQRQVRERGEVARGADRTLAGDHRRDALVQHVSVEADGGRDTG
mgnify:CR=1 FL=1